MAIRNLDRADRVPPRSVWRKAWRVLHAVLLLAAVAALAPAKADQPHDSAPAISARFVPIANGVPGVLYAPAEPGAKAATAVLIMHSSGDYLAWPGCGELARRGYRAFCVNNSTSKSGAFNDGIFDQVLLELKAAMVALRAEPGVKRVVLLGHSGGGSVASAYQMIAEAGVKACQGADKIWSCPETLAGLPAADGLMLIDSNWGLGAMTLFSLDPAVTDEASGIKLDPALDMFNPANGFHPSGSRYDPAFVKAFLTREGQRNNALIAQAQAQYALVRAGQGAFEDDALLAIPGASLLGGNNKLFSQDTALMAHTQDAYPLIHADGSITRQIVQTVRVPENTRNLSPSLARGALRTTLRSYLNTYAIRVSPEYGYDASGVRGIEWTSSYASPPGNVQQVRVPLLVMGMTGHWEFLAAETIYRLAASKDRTIAFVEGADHSFKTCQPCERRPGEFGDTRKLTFDYIDQWLSRPDRFLP